MQQKLANCLYDLKTDPGENENIAGYSENAELVGKLGKLLDKGKEWKNFRPKKA